MKIIKPLFVFFTFSFLFAGFFHPISAIAQDLGRHFLLGRIILETKQVPLTNLFSYTYPDFPFVNLHWLSEVIFYIVHQLVNYNGLLIFSTLTVLASFSFIYFYLIKKANIFALTITSFFYIKILFERTDIRPEIFSFLFLSIFIVILYKNREKFTRWIFILPLIELLWVNMHIYFIVGIAVIGLFLTEQLFTFLKRGVTGAGGPHRVPAANEESEDIGWGKSLAGPRALLFVFFLAIFATLINPNFLNGALYPFRVFQNYGYSIEENQNIFFLWQVFQKSTVPYFIASILLLFAVLLLNIKKSKPIDWMLSIFFTIFAITAIRNFPLFVFTTFIPFTINFSDLSENILAKVQPSSGLNLIKNVAVSFLFILISWQTIEVIKVKGFGFGVETGAKNAADFFIQENIKGPIFNNFDVGGYLDYRLYPKEKVFVDNRPEEYPASFFQNTYIPMQNNIDIFNKVSQKYNFNSIFFSHTDQTPWAHSFLKQITNNNEWRIIYLDDYIIILVKNNDINKTLINKFETTSASFSFEKFKKDKSSLARLSIFFQRSGWNLLEIEAYQSILLLDPDYCPAIYNLARVLSFENNQSASIYLSKFKYKCQ